MSAGYVYILINNSMPDLIKIGRTLRDSNARARELQSTGVPTPFTVAYEVFVDNHEHLETKIFQELNEFRVSGNREFFRFPLKKAIDCLLSLAHLPKDISSAYAAESIFSHLTNKYHSWMRPEIVDVRIVQTNDRVWLEITEEEIINKQLVDQVIRRSDLGFCASSDTEMDEIYFKPSDSVSVNAAKFLTDWTPYSIIMTTDLFHEQACHQIGNDEELNPHIKKHFPK